MLFYLGIDESNHGRFPVFYVGVLTVMKRDIVPNQYEKIRRVPLEDLNSTDRFFRYVPIFKEHMDMLRDPRSAKLIAYSELIRNFTTVRNVLIDGELEEKELELLVEMLDMEHPPEIITGSHFDTTFGVVNDADYVASQIRRHWNDKTKHPKQRERYLGHMISPRLDRYQDLLRIPQKQDSSHPRKISDGYFNTTGRTRGGVLHRI